jgi:hypothetical protein
MNEIDRILNSDQPNDISAQDPKPYEGLGRDNDQLAHDPKNTSKERSLDDEEEMLPSDDDILGEAVDNATKKRLS